MSQYDTIELHNFLLHTPEGGLRKMLVDGDPMADAHFNLLMKIVKKCSPTEFSECVDSKSFPKLKFGPSELKIKENFWDDCLKTLAARGIAQPMPAGGHPKPDAA